MEPKFELATVITSHIWLIHELSPNERSVLSILNSQWKERLHAQAAADYARLRVLLDLADFVFEQPWDPENPLGEFLSPGKEETSFFQKLKRLVPFRRQSPESRSQAIPARAAEVDIASTISRAGEENDRRDVADFALETIANRIKALTEQGFAEDLDRSLGLEPSVNEIDSTALRTPALLTREDLFERVANWILLLPPNKVFALAKEFLSLDRFLVRRKLSEKAIEISRHSQDPKQQSAREWLGKTDADRLKIVLSNEDLLNWCRFLDIPVSIPSADRFLMSKEITRRADEISTDSRHPERKRATKWLCKNDTEKLEILLTDDQLHEWCCALDVPVPFSMVLKDELEELALSRNARLYPNGKISQTPNPSTAKTGPQVSSKEIRRYGVDLGASSSQQRAFRSNLVGLAFSGGGIRSATFGLGLLQGMADRNILPYIDLVSTVSGGGYIASWLIAWIKRRGSAASVQQSLRGSASWLRGEPTGISGSAQEKSAAPPDALKTVTRNSDPRADHVRPIRLLREYARYLAPQAGVLSTDTWTIFSTWLRNTVLNLSVLTLFLGVTLLMPRLVIFVLLHARVFSTPFQLAITKPSAITAAVIMAVVITGIPLLVACGLIRKRNLRSFGPYAGKKETTSRGESDSQIVSGIMPWILFGAFLEVTMLWNFLGSYQHLAFWASMAFGAVVLTGIWILSGHTKKGFIATQASDGFPLKIKIIAVMGSAFVGFSLVYGFSSLMNDFGANTMSGVWFAGSAGISLMLLIILTVGVVFIALAGRDLSDEQREWWSRLGAWFLLAIGGWLVICAICFFVPLWLTSLKLRIATLGISWGAITAAGVKLAFSAKSGRNGDGTQPWYYKVLLIIAPAAFILGILSIVSVLLLWAIEKVISHWSFLSGDSVAHELCCTSLNFFTSVQQNYWPLMYPGSIASILLMVMLGLLCVLLAWRVDVNEFSMHHFYKNRLVRAYLGASRARAHRQPNAFTGFDLEDDIPLSRFRNRDETHPRDLVRDCMASYAGPYPIINSALNITRGQDLGIQERKAESFTFTPLWSGFDFSRRQVAVKKVTSTEYAFQQTNKFGAPRDGRKLASDTSTRVDAGASLGTAMAISGAAFTSNAGFHTSPSLAFLLTVFGVRLGWWAGNPRKQTWQKSSPTFGLFCLVRELTANTSTLAPFVLLSDGGHFENMGLYELIRRRCRYIILSDAEEDEHFKLEGIGGAIRKCRDDFGVQIDISLEALQPLGDPAVSRLHYSLGSILYPGEASCGHFLYIKSSVTGNEPIDVIEFRKSHKEFPHTSTVDQFFDESHFESYRALGHHIASEIFSEDMDPPPIPTAQDPAVRVERLFQRIEEDWHKRLEQAKTESAKEKLRSVLDTAKRWSES